jgi:tetratricopeptide (TPR) repeat protein
MSPAKQGLTRPWAILAALLFLLPLGLPLAQFLAQRRDSRDAERAAEKELSGSLPRREAWGVLGTIRLEQGRIAEALPLLRKASQLEAVAGLDTRDTLALAKADLDGCSRGVPGATRREAEQALERAEALAPKLPQGRQAAAWFSAGLYRQELGDRPRTLADLGKAVALQRDDWVDEGNGLRYKSAGLSAYYQKMLAGATDE